METVITQILLKLRCNLDVTNRQMKLAMEIILAPHQFQALKRIPLTLREKCSNTEFFLVRIFLYSDRIQKNTDQKKLRLWTLFTQCKFKRNERKVPSNDIKYKLLKSANDLINGDDASQDSAQARFNMNDEDDLFCDGLAKRVKKINPRSRGNLRVQIERLTNQAEFSLVPIPQLSQNATLP